MDLLGVGQAVIMLWLNALSKLMSRESPRDLNTDFDSLVLERSLKF